MSGVLPTQVQVFLDAGELGSTRRVGTLRPVGRSPGAPVMFAYAQDWVDDPGFFLLDPSHLPYVGDQLSPDGRLAGIFTDTAPDRWGRVLMDRREADRAMAEGRRSRALSDWDYLLGVNDLLRMGALRFSGPDGEPYLDPDPTSVPPVAGLRELEQAVREIEHPSGRRGPALSAAIAMLVAPASPLGGARPKTSFRFEDDGLWIAKFPSRTDRRDVGAWEFVLNELARRSGIEVPETRLLQYAGPHHTFAAKRFDRSREDRRLFASAMTLLGKRDREPASYVEIAGAIADFGAPGAIDNDLAQLFRRLVFNILVGHRDDHLRNHGFLRHPEGWRLAPAYDLNPMPDLLEHELAVGLDSHAPSVALAVDETAPFCRLKRERAHAIVAEVRSAIAGWRDLASAHDLPGGEVELISTVISEAD